MKKPSAELRILGHTELSVADNVTGGAVLRQPKRLGLLAYLALATTNGFRRRDQIVGIFWPELDQMHARTQLRKALHGLRAILGTDAFVTRGEEEIRLDTDHVWCDGVVFRRHVEAREWSDALALYRGDLLEGLFPGGVGEEFERWLYEQRSDLRELASRAAWECSSQADLTGDRAAAIAFARQAAELAPDDEEGMRRLIAALDRHGDRAGALRAFTEWQARLQKEFGAEPDPVTRKLVRKVQAPRKGESIETPRILSSLQSSQVSPVTPAATQSTPASGQQPARPRRSLTPAIIAWSAVGLISLSLAVFGMSARSSGRGELAAIAVLPLRGLGDSVAAAIGQGIAEELTAGLTQTSGISVRSSARMRQVIDDAGDIEDIGRRLAVRNVLDGTVQRDESHVRVTLRLVRVSDALTLWARSFDFAASDLLASQEQIAKTTAIATVPLVSR
jgi:DNA-binding SARP family transcriptional activator/TolB-like protein